MICIFQAVIEKVKKLHAGAIKRMTNFLIEEAELCYKLPSCIRGGALKIVSCHHLPK
jgi:hypothetical protein